MEKQKRIASFRDLDVYQISYKTCIRVMTELLPKLPDSEKYDLRDQLSRSVKAVPRLIAEGYAKRHQKFGFQKYLVTQWLNVMKRLLDSKCVEMYTKLIVIWTN